METSCGEKMENLKLGLSYTRPWSRGVGGRRGRRKETDKEDIEGEKETSNNWC